MGLVLSMQIPFVGFQPIRTSEHMAAAGKSNPLSTSTVADPAFLSEEQVLTLETLNMNAAPRVIMKSAFLGKMLQPEVLILSQRSHHMTKKGRFGSLSCKQLNFFLRS